MSCGSYETPTRSHHLWIAATALTYDFTLVTADQRHASLPLIRTVLVGKLQNKPRPA
jgi:predicted nucleic acid-binding protein